MRKPNPFLHMTLWGLGGGVALGILYGVSLLLFTALSEGMPANFGEFFGVLGFGAYFGAMFGGVPGLILGVIDGVILWALLRTLPEQFNVDDLLAHQKRAQWAIAIVTFVGIYIVAAVFLSGIMSIVLVGVPSLIAAFAAFTVTRRYFTRLAPLAEKGKRKAKEA